MRVSGLGSRQRKIAASLLRFSLSQAASTAATVSRNGVHQECDTKTVAVPTAGWFTGSGPVLPTKIASAKETSGVASVSLMMIAFRTFSVVASAVVGGAGSEDCSFNTWGHRCSGLAGLTSDVMGSDKIAKNPWGDALSCDRQEAGFTSQPLTTLTVHARTDSMTVLYDPHQLGPVCPGHPDRLIASRDS